METLSYLSQLINEMASEVRGDIEVGETFAFTYSEQEFIGRVYERFNGHLVVAFEAEVCTTKFDRGKQDLVNRLNGQLPFTIFKMTKASGGLQKISATHSLLVGAVDVDQLVQSLDSIAYQVKEQRPILSRTEKLSPEAEKLFSTDDDEDDEPCIVEVVRDGVDDLIDDGIDNDSDDDSDDGEQNSNARASKPQIRKTSATTGEILAELYRLVGLEPVKLEVRRLVASREFSRARVAEGLPAIQQSPHLVFTGNPGTGKTTVARLVADLYKALGILKKGHVIEADCSKLIASYIGQTPIKTRRLCEQARGGVLFIDEAYGLSSQEHRGYGSEAIETLLKFMEDNRGEIVVIVAGYPKEMQGFLDANPGLRSRFDVVIDFPDYSNAELASIFDIYLADHELTMTPEAKLKVVEHVKAMPRERGFGNGRAMRNLFNEIIRRHAVWATRDGDVDIGDLTVIPAEMVPGIKESKLVMSGGNGVRGYL